MIASPALVPLSGLLEARPDEEPAANDDRPIEAQLAGRRVWVTAVLERTCVYRLEPNAFAERGVAKFADLLVEPASVTWRTRAAAKEREAAARGRARAQQARWGRDNDEGELEVLGAGALDELPADDTPAGQAEPISTPRPQVTEPEEAPMPKVCHLCGREDGAKTSPKSNGRIRVGEDGICSLHWAHRKRPAPATAESRVAEVVAFGTEGSADYTWGATTGSGVANSTIIVTADLSDALPDPTPLPIRQLAELERLLDTAAEAATRITELEDEVVRLREQLRVSDGLRSELEARIGGLAARLLGQ